MALTVDQLALLRTMIDEKTDANGWTDTALELLAGRYVDAEGVYDLNAAAADGWSTKAARYVELVQVNESGSSRALNQMFDHAVAMAKLFEAKKSSAAPAPIAAAPMSTKIVRATREG